MESIKLNDSEVFNAIEGNYPDEFVNGIDEESLLGAFRRNPKRAKRAISQRKSKSVVVQSNGAATSMSRGEFEQRFGQLSEEIKKGLLSGAKQIVDSEFYIIKSVSGMTSLRVLRDDDKKVDGLSNISGGKIEKGEVFLLSAIQLLSGVGSAATESAAVAGIVEFGIIEKNLRNGTFLVRGNGKTLVPAHGTQAFANQLVTKQTFNITGDYDVVTGVVGVATTNIGEQTRPGLLKLSNPKMIESQVQIDFDLAWGAAPTTNTFVKLSLIGSRVINY